MTHTRFTGSWLCAGMALLLWGASWLAAIASPEPEVPVVLRTAVKALAEQRHGITVLHREYASDLHAPGRNEHTDVVSARVRQDGRIVAVRLYRKTVNGAAVAADELAKEQAALDKKPPNDEYRLPFSEESLAEYRFGPPAACTGCESGVVAIPFTSLKRDDDHGDGTVYVDEHARHITRLDLKPSVNSKQADSGEITMTLGKVTPDLWDVVWVKQRYAGHRLIAHWTFETSATHSAYRRFDSLDAARAALLSGP